MEKETIRKRIGEDQLEEAIQQWAPHLAGDSRSNELIQQMARLTTASTERKRGTIEFREENRVRNEVRIALLDLLNNWNPGGDLSQLEKAIANLHIRPDNTISALHLFNCDRVRQGKSFRKAFNLRKDKSPFQFYFVAACPNEMPTSFSKRMVYEIVRDHLDERHDAISFPTQDDDDRIRVEPLPLGSDLESSIKQLKKYVAHRFRFTDTQSFDTFIETGIPKLPYHYVTAVFEIADNKWDGDEGEIRDYFQWMMRTFQCPNPEVPTFLFFIVVKSRHLQSEERQQTPRQKTILSELSSLCKEHPDQATLLADFPAVGEDDFETWAAETHGVDNPNLARKVTEALAASFKPDSPETVLYHRHQKFHMKDIEPLQKQIFKIATK